MYFCELNIGFNNMNSPQKRLDALFAIYRDARSVFTLSDVAMLTGEGDYKSLSWKMNYYARTGKILNPRKGMYAKEGFQVEELACKLYTPSYLSLEYVLQRAGVVFQYDTALTCVGTVSREITVGRDTIKYRRIKDEILINTAGIIREGCINTASPERAFLDVLYLDSSYYFDNPGKLDRSKVEALLPIYGSKKLVQTVKKIFNDK